jgi:hypothetical protein
LVNIIYYHFIYKIKQEKENSLNLVDCDKIIILSGCLPLPHMAFGCCIGCL